ncbi:uncharacterized protein MONOS_15356 [Monocercomonoides exilis]|uniref:uncharacterized protein n=1 Tax=Monocercomonoides exilis TaxID=2049356 RepID=UPI00355948ED|nr:hypothetical protein MONOS_15356 [Monocercomonoides exilis]|eukprot:MONOS_15356.1-p1 / transcript=MONOS_15356.1 / gene=MONOS_15356 / organism=Monocercomonoides_exilis_PA203 / gene_product=unspecified product / transcript_product=unspecified product / location=Mono_scaffold01207:11229-11963(-) / protein_length=245 / sequence_SO=supercontig / SO=protein_coding / is_pseudo=false
MVMASSVLCESSNLTNIVNIGSGEGGVASVTLRNEEDLIINSTNASSCSLSSGNGKGGFLYLECQNCLDEKPFIFDVSVTFENSNAVIGKNVFILGKDFNFSVTTLAFRYDYSSMTGDNNLFVGSDSYHSNKDLFMFLVPYNSMEIFISSEGFDVARCGSEEEPCFTTWKGMKNMKKEENATISVRVVMIVDCQIGGEESKEGSGSLVVDMWMVSVKFMEIQKESVFVRGTEFYEGVILREEKG